LPFHQQAADELGGNQLGGASEEGLGEGWEGLGGRGGYGSGLGGNDQNLMIIRKANQSLHPERPIKPVQS